MGYRRIKTNSCSLHHNNLDRIHPGIKEEVKTVLEMHPESDRNQIIPVNLNTLDPSSITTLVDCFTDTTCWKD